MSFLERVDDLIRKKNINRNTVTKNVEGLNHNTFHAWEKRGNIPSGDVVVKIADYFGVSTDFLLTGKEPQAELDGVPVSVPLELSTVLTAATGGSDDITQEEIDELADYWNKIVKPRRMK